MVEGCWHIREMRELISGIVVVEFGAHRTDEKGDWDGGFKRHLDRFEVISIQLNFGNYILIQ